MKNILLCALTLSFAPIFSQQNETVINPPVSDTTTHNENKKKVYHEIGVNTTYLIKQLFSSNNFIEIQPYQLTYKLIKNNWSLRSAFGFNYFHGNSDETVLSDPYYNAPDKIRPSFSNSTNVFGRFGWEYRFHLGRKIIAYTGIDIIAESLKSESENQTISNYLPNSYYFESSKSRVTKSSAGIGPVIGIQFYATKRLSIYTEIPIYFVQSRTENFQQNYANMLSSSNNYVTSYKTIISTQETRSAKITLPATIYLAIKF